MNSNELVMMLLGTVMFFMVVGGLMTDLGMIKKGKLS